MRISYITTVAALTAVTVAKPHLHGHRHAHEVVKRVPQPDKIVYAPAVIETVVKYVLDGHDVSAEDVRLGLANGTLEWGADGILSSSTKATSALATPPRYPGS
jgi:SUN family beta-glucosidase